MAFAIQPVATALRSELQRRLDERAGRAASLGVLARLALRVGLIQNSLTPRLSKPAIALFAADHGAAVAAVSPEPAAMTQQTVRDILAGTNVINVLAHENGLDLVLVDVGVDGDCPADAPMVRARVARGTANYVAQPAMTRAQCEQALASGAEVIDQLHFNGCNSVGFGALGSGNNASAALLMALLCKLPLERCVGSEDGLDAAGGYHRVKILHQARERAATVELRRDPVGLLAEYGGFEIAAVCGGMLRAAEHGMVILIDGFVTGSALLAARRLHPGVLDYCIASHRTDDAAHTLMLQQLHGQPLLDLRLKLGHGAGAALAYPLLRSAVALLGDEPTGSHAPGPDNT